MKAYKAKSKNVAGYKLNYVSIKNEEFYIAKQIFKEVLGYSWFKKSVIESKVSPENMRKVRVDISNNYFLNVINLRGFYEAVSRSRRGSDELAEELFQLLGSNSRIQKRTAYSYDNQKLKPKKFNFNEFEVTAFEIGGEPYFLGTELTRVLGYKNPRDAIYRYVDLGDTLSVEIHDGKTPGSQHRVLINEPGLYDLIRGSHLPGAERFKYWVSHEVLPSIRKTGGYSINQAPLTDENLRDQLLNPDTIIKIAQNWKEEQEKNKLLTEQNQMLEVEIKKTEPIVTYTNKVLRNTGLITVTNVASSFGIKGHTSAIKFNELLQSLGIQYKRGKTWYLRNKFEGNDYTFHQETDNRGNECTPFMKWTQKGRLFLYEQLTKAGYKIKED